MSGLINHDSITLSTGQSVSDSYVCADFPVNIEKRDGNFEVSTILSVYLDQACCNASKNPLLRTPLNFTIECSPAYDGLGNIYDHILDEMKVLYANHTVA